MKFYKSEDIPKRKTDLFYTFTSIYCSKKIFEAIFHVI